MHEDGAFHEVLHAIAIAGEHRLNVFHGLAAFGFDAAFDQFERQGFDADHSGQIKGVSGHDNFAEGQVACGKDCAGIQTFDACFCRGDLGCQDRGGGE